MRGEAQAGGVVVASQWWRRPYWWPALVLAVLLVAGLIFLAATPGSARGPAPIFAPDARPHAIPESDRSPPLIDLNRASRAELETLPGIGAQRAAAIIDARDAAPFTSLADLVDRDILSRGTAEGLLGLARAHPAEAQAAAAPLAETEP